MQRNAINDRFIRLSVCGCGREHFCCLLHSLFFFFSFGHSSSDDEEFFCWSGDIEIFFSSHMILHLTGMRCSGRVESRAARVYGTVDTGQGRVLNVMSVTRRVDQLSNVYYGTSAPAELHSSSVLE